VNYLMTRRRRNAAPADDASLSDEVILLAEIRDLLRQQRPA
jgi:large-conductance mechanosensitive channel